MLALPTPMIRLLRSMESVFEEHTWEHARVLLVRAMLNPAKRTVTSALSVMGLRQEPQFQTCSLPEKDLDSAMKKSKGYRILGAKQTVVSVIPGGIPCMK
jgi:hypothetical protein